MFAVIEFVWTIFTTLLGLALVLAVVLGVPAIVWSWFQDEMDAADARRDRRDRRRRKK